MYYNTIEIQNILTTTLNQEGSRMKNQLLLLISCAIIFFGCSKNNPTAPPIVPPEAKGVYILNEGNFNRNNSTLTYYVPDSNKVYDNIFESVNQKKLGDTGNSITIYNGKAYIVVNGSNRIEIVDTKTQKSMGAITCPDGASPRHIVFTDAGKAFISNLYDNSVSEADVTANTITGKISVGTNPEEMFAAGDYLYVTNSGFGKGRTVSVINVNMKAVVKTLTVGDNPIHIRRWNTTTAVVLCGGDIGNFSDPNDDTPGKIFFINLANESISDSMTVGGHPFKIAIDDNNNLFTIGSKGVMRMNLLTKTILSDSFIAGNFYSVAYDAQRKQLYATDPKDYVQPGTVSIFDLNGALLRSFGAGVNPGWISFVE